MTNTKNTKRALLSSVMALFLCFAMLLGTTFAWFTDSVTSGSNIIQSGTLDIDLVDADGNSMEGQIIEFVAADGRAQDLILWEPGCTYQTEPVYVVNKGSLDLKYNILVNGIVGDAKLLEVIEWTVTIDGVEIDMYTYENKLLAGETSGAIVLTGHMKETAGNEYMGLTANGISISVFATQLTSENDSFDNQYDKDAVYYDALATTDEELKAAILAPECKVIAVKGDLTYNWGGNSYENSEALYMKGKTIVGFDKNSSITFAGYGSANPITDVTLKNITVKDTTAGDNEGAWEHGHLEFVSLKAQDVVFADTIMLDGNSTLVNCSMINNTASWYGIWIEGGNTVIEDCTFSGTRSIKIHEAYGSDVESVVIDGCVIGALSEKPGVVIGDLDADTVVTIKNNTFDSVQAGDQGMFVYESDTGVNTFKFTNENNTVISSVTDIAQLSEAFAKGGYIVLESDLSITLTENAAGFDYPIAFVANSGNPVVLDLNGHTIKVESEMNDTVLVHALDTDVTIKNGNFVIDGGQYSNLIWAKGNSNVTIENGTFESPNEDAIMLYVSDNNGEKATININGGEFISNGATAQNHINIRNHGLGKVIITGGTFNFNPDWSVYTDVHAVDDAAHIIIAEGYHSVDNGNGTWTVVAD